MLGYAEQVVVRLSPQELEGMGVSLVLVDGGEIPDCITLVQILGD